MWSNGSGVQPKDLDEHQTAFDELLSKLKDVPLPQLDDGSASGKIQRLRQVPSGTLIDVVEKIDHSQFRGFSDGDFIHKDLIRNINSGDYGRRMKRRNIRLLIGECRDENFLYRAWKTPPEDSWESLRARLLEDYPVATVDKVLELYAPGRCLPARKDGIDCWSVLFGKIYADLQVHCLERGFINALSKDDGGGGGGGGMMVVGEDILRYRVEWRARCTDAAWPREWRVTHGTDDGIWWWGNGWPPGLTAAEKQTAKPLNDAFARFVAGERLVEWERKKGPRWVWRLSDRGVMDHWEDSRWDEAQVVWNVVNGTSSSPEARL
jgi:carboxylesterase type B